MAPLIVAPVADKTPPSVTPNFPEVVVIAPFEYIVNPVVVT
jgi:hypothetical protein